MNYLAQNKIMTFIRVIIVCHISLFSINTFADVSPSDRQEIEMIFGDQLGTSLFADYVRRIDFQIEKSDQNLLNELAFLVKTTGSELGVATFDQGSPVDLSYSRAPEKFYVDPHNLRRLLSVPTSEVRYKNIQELGSFIPPLFFGYTKGINELQVISFNKSLKRYDFLVINNYGTDDKAEMFIPNRKFCISCHQSETPHFSRRPWKTTFFANQNLVSEAEHEGIKFASSAASFDSSIQESAEALQALRVCDTACSPGDTSCRKRLLSYVFLGPKIKREAYLDRAKYYRFFNRDFKDNFKGTWPENNYAYPSNVLAQYEPTNIETDYYLFSNSLDPFNLSEALFNFNGSRPGKDHSLFYAQIEQMNSPVAFGYLTEFRGVLDFEEVGEKVDGLNRQTVHNNIHGTGLENPVSLRPLVGQIPLEFAAEALMKAGNLGACHFMHNSQVRSFNRNKSLGQIYNYFMNDPEIDDLVSNQWPLDFDEVQKFVRSARAKNISEFPIDLSVPTSVQNLKERAQSKIAELAKPLEAIDLGENLQEIQCDPTTKYVMTPPLMEDFEKFKNQLKAIESGAKDPLSLPQTESVIQRSCAQCHDPGHDKTILPVSMDLEGLSVWGLQYDRPDLGLEKVACMNMPPAIFKTQPQLDHGSKVLISPRERASIVYWLKTIKIRDSN